MECFKLIMDSHYDYPILKYVYGRMVTSPRLPPRPYMVQHAGATRPPLLMLMVAIPFATHPRSPYPTPTPPLPLHFIGTIALQFLYCRQQSLPCSSSWSFISYTIRPMYYESLCGSSLPAYNAFGSPDSRNVAGVYRRCGGGLEGRFKGE